MSRIKRPIDDKSWVILGAFGVLLLVGWYMWISNRQHARNPEDTTIPNIGQLIEGFKMMTTPRESSLAAAFGGEEEKGFWAKLNQTWLYRDALATYMRLFKGIFWGCVISFVMGILMGCYEWIAAIFLPPLSFLAKVPGTAMLAVFFVLVGTGESMFVSMIGFGILPTLTQAIYLSAKHDLHEEEINKAYTLGASSLEVILHVVIPQTLPKVMEAVRLQIGPSMVYLIAAEMLVGQVGMGYQIRMQQRLLNMNIVYDYILILGLTGLLMDKGMSVLRKYFCPWYEKAR